MKITFMPDIQNKITKFMKVATAASIMLAIGNANAVLPTPVPAMNGSTGSAHDNNAATGIQSKTVAALVSMDAQGRQTLQAIDTNTRVQRGDIIEYRSYLTNTNSNRVREMQVTVSIPQEVSLVGDVLPTIVSASINGAQFGYMPLQGQINGQVQDIPLEYYRYLRWTIEDLGLNETAMVKYRAVVR